MCGLQATRQQNISRITTWGKTGWGDFSITKRTMIWIISPWEQLPKNISVSVSPIPNFLFNLENYLTTCLFTEVSPTNSCQKIPVNCLKYLLRRDLKSPIFHDGPLKEVKHSFWVEGSVNHVMYKTLFVTFTNITSFYFFN